jgi:pyruvate-ferredoxin/flavodoxin oxidoreductase
MSQGMDHQKQAVQSGYWPLWRYVPEAVERGEHPFMLDSKAPSIPLKDFEQTEARFAMLARSDPERARTLGARAQVDVDERRHVYEQMAGIDHGHGDAEAPDPSRPSEEEAP